jgi:hypothetical protein
MLLQQQQQSVQPVPKLAPPQERVQEPGPALMQQLPR